MSPSKQQAGRKKIAKDEVVNGNGPLSLKNIEKYLKFSKTYMGAVFVKSFNKLLLKTKEYSLVVYCNFHWFCIFCTKHTFEIFDPLGFLQKAKCLNAKFFLFLKTHLKGKLFYCNPQIQSNTSYQCGLYVAFFIRMRELGNSFHEILRKFSKDFRKNDQLVKQYMKKISLV